MSFNKILDVLRKLGIIRFGKAGWSGEAKERKIEMIMDNVFDAKKDLINGAEDVKKKQEK